MLIFMEAIPLRWFLVLNLVAFFAHQSQGEQTGATIKLLPDIRMKAESSDALAQYNLGMGYYKGLGVTKDAAEAVKWYRKAAEQGFAKAQFALGFCYGNGLGVVKDVAEAVKWYQKAAEQGLAEAANNLGICYYKGEGVPRNHAQAVTLYRRSAE